MILTGIEIERQVLSGEITISPFDPSCLNPNSYNYHLGDKLLKLSPTSKFPYPIDSCADGVLPIADIEYSRIPSEGMVLFPGNLYLGHTAEVIGSIKFLTTLIGKSSVGRLGMFLQVSANIGHQGSCHSWTLEICCRTPIRVYPNQIVGQVSFWHSIGNPFTKDGHYNKHNSPTMTRALEDTITAHSSPQPWENQ